ncbi:hypothetical protein Zmor_026156 [Zophobas morio]|uniref:Annexin n=1 Tax=Zophobas morio TaxID=2755281 RepID=A0AA38M4U7_9CUCU|nr:hypothetical protein Zmor_026156 [Zophobas morio]
MSMYGTCRCKKTFHPGNAPTVFPSRFFLVREDAEDLYQALHADTTDVATIINILAKRSLAQRLEIVNEYRTLHDADLIEDLRSKLSGDFESLIVAMMTPLDQYYASELNYAMVGAGTDENDLTEILCTLSNAEILAVRRSYHQQYAVKLEDAVIDDTSDEYRDLLLSLCRTERDEYQHPDQEAALTDANSMYNATSDTRWNVYHDVFCHRSYAQLQLVFNEYQNVAGKSIDDAIDDFFSGDVKTGLLAIVGDVKNPAKFFAEQLHATMAGLGTSDRDLMRLVVTRSEIDMADIKKEYETLYTATLATDIVEDTSGDYQKCLLVLIGEEPQ